MRNVILCILAFCLLVLGGCGGGGNPITPDLAGLEGTWDYNWVYNGNLNGPGDPIPINDSYSSFFIIGRNSVIDDEGKPMVWSYNGTTLMIKDASSETDFDVDCGNIYMSGSLELRVPLTAASTVGNIGGTIALTLASQYCGDYSGTLLLTGNMTKR